MMPMINHFSICLLANKLALRHILYIAADLSKYSTIY